MSSLVSCATRGARALVVALLAAVPGAVAEEAAPGLEFLRVHVPRGRIGDVPLGSGRYVPIPAAEFEQAVARLGPRQRGETAAPRLLADRARYELAVDDAGRLSGIVAFEVGEVAAGTQPVLELGAVRPGRCTVRTAAGTGDAIVFGHGDGTVAVRTPESGTYACEVSVDSVAAFGRAYHVPLVPALTNTIVVRPPAGLNPVVSDAGAGRAFAHADGAGGWRVECGPAAFVTLAFLPEDADPPRIAAWSDVVLRGRRVDVATALLPRTAWRPGELVIDKPAGLRLVSAGLVPGGRPLDWSELRAGQAARITLPGEVSGRNEPLVVRGVAMLSDAANWQVPLVRPPVEAWAGGGTRVDVDPVLGALGLVATDCQFVTPEVARRWPLPARSDGRDAPTAGAVRPALFMVEHQSAEPRLSLRLQPRRPQFDVARLTTVEMSPGQVLGRATCDLRVVTGETFSVNARIAPGWLIDSVELIDPFDLPTEVDDRRRAGEAAVEWRVTRGRDGDETLRIGLAMAATPQRGLGLRVTGHRQGVPLGGEFRTGDMDMVRFEGEAADAAVVDFNVGAEAVVEIDGMPLGILPIPARLAPLVEPGTLGGRIPGGERAADQRARLVRRRAPLDVDIDVRLAARDERLVEAFTMTCRPEAAAVDAVVVHFSEPMGDGLEWSLLEPTGGSLVARRLDAADTARGDGPLIPACVESWLVEITPAFTGVATLRAVRDVAFRAPQPVPLAWVEGATTSRGTVAVRDTGPARPTVLNRRLRELPPLLGADGPQAALLEFAFSVPRPGEEATPAAELIPPAGAESRSWAWSEAVSCWCYGSGRAECQTVFDIENHGRDHVLLDVPPGRRVEAVRVDEAFVPVDSLAGGGMTRVPLPPQVRRLRLVVRTVAAVAPGLGMWRVEPLGCGIDVPVLEHRLTLMLPPDLEIVTPPAGYREAAAKAAGLWERLFAARPVAAEPDPPPGDDLTAAGFRPRRFVPVSGAKVAGCVVVRRPLVASLAIGVGFLASLAVLAIPRRRLAGAVLLSAAVAVSAVWLEEPLATVARAAWWGCLVGFGWRAVAGWGSPAIAGACAVVIGCGHGVAATGAEVIPDLGQPFKVFLMPGDEGDVALVPEPLYRVLLKGGPPAAAVRIVRCHVLAEDGAAPAAWRLSMEIDADAGGAVVLDQEPAAARWERPPDATDTIQLDPDGRRLRLVVPRAGLQRVELRVVPAMERRGGLEMASISLPPAAVTHLQLVDGNGSAIAAPADAVQCDRATADGPFLPARAAADGAGFDVSGAARVRLVRPSDRRDRLAVGGLTATSENALEWELDGCTVRARFDVGGEAIVRAVVVAADPGLEPGEGNAGESQRVTPLGHGRFLLEGTAPETGPARFALALRMPLVDPVGAFAAPGAWLEDCDTDARTVRLVAAPDLLASFGVVPAAAGESQEDGVAAGDVWRYDASRGTLAAARPRLAISRRRQEIRGVQSLAVGIDAEGFGLRLQARIDAASTPLVEIPVRVPAGCLVERVTVREDDLLVPDAGSRPPLDVQWSLAEDRLGIVVQQPRAGRYRLEVEGRLLRRPDPAGRLPLLRAELAGNSPLNVSWSRLGTSPTAAVTVEVPPGGAAPAYDLDKDQPAAVPPPSVVAAPGAAPFRGEDRVARARIAARVDARGRLCGLARYDLVASGNTLRLRLPPRTRLFDVSIDGRDVTARPVATDAWEVRFHEASWPRSLQIVFAGEMEPEAGVGRPIRLLPPVIEGFAVAETIWTISPPAGMELRVATPSRWLAQPAWDAAIATARDRVKAAFDLSLAAAAHDPDIERLRGFAASRATTDEQSPQASWAWAGESAADAPPARVATAGTDGLTARLVRRQDASVPARAAATVALAVVVAVGWLAAGRSAASGSRPLATWNTIAPWLLAAGGAGWAARLSPAAPGWLMLAGGVTAVLVRWRVSRGAAAVGRGAAWHDSAATHSLRGG